MTVIKFKEGFIVTPEHQILPKPLHLYTPKDKSWILPLDFVFSAVWALELVTHLEELAFWLYLLHQNAHKAEWFSSWEYRLWYFGSVVAIVGLPLTTLITRRNLETCDAYIFLVGASGSTVTTICFLYVLWHFPAFIAHVKAEGADPTVVVRLATFYQLNLARIVFRFLFTIPLFILAMDGVISSPHIINHNVFSTDFLHMLGGIGCFVSTTITLLIFFPRSIVNEAGYRPKAPTIAASSPKTVNTESPNLVHSEYALQSYDGFGIASPEYVLDMQPEDVNIHYPYPHSLAKLSHHFGAFFATSILAWSNQIYDRPALLAYAGTDISHQESRTDRDDLISASNISQTASTNSKSCRSTALSCRAV
ncbi:hypothetical protein EUX98_g5150 [Antrodiella citrinella]|uniref:Uncharacterized protein n=1 Tax=Antrodiella citrinella TaxID=2447956 RepID=A0A4S4MSG2_9APHY|nr:hypothetical protein EUX98_g5150 [Antrodiella citrinella]